MKNRKNNLSYGKVFAIALLLITAVMLFCFNNCFAQDNVNNIQQKAYQKQLAEAKYNDDKANELFKEKKYDESIEYYKKSQKIYKKLNLVKLEILTLIGAGNNYNEKKDYEKAIHYYEEAQELNVGKYYNKMVAYLISNGLACSYMGNKKYNEAILLYEKALELLNKNNELKYPCAKFIYINLGFIYETNKKYWTALEYYKKAFDFEPESKFLYDKISICMQEISMEVYNKLLSRNYKEVIADIDNSMKYINEIPNNKYFLLWAFSYKGLAFEGLGLFGDAQENFEKSLTISMELNDKKQILRSLIDLAYLNNKFGNYLTSIDFYGKARDLLKENKDVVGLLNLTYSMKNIFSLLGKHEDSIGLAKDTLAYIEKQDIDEFKEEAYALLGDIYANNIIIPDKAIEYINKSIELGRDKNHPNIQIKNYLNLISVFCWKKESFDKINSYFKKTFSLYEKYKKEIDDVKYTYLRNNLFLQKELFISMAEKVNRIDIVKDLRSEAYEKFDESLTGEETLKASQIFRCVLNNKFNEALQKLDEFKKIYSAKNISIERDVRARLGITMFETWIYYNAGELEKAFESGKKFVELTEQLRPFYKNDDIKIGFMWDKIQIYNCMIQCALKLYYKTKNIKYLDSARQYINMYKSRALLDMINNNAIYVFSDEELLRAENLRIEIEELDGNLQKQFFEKGKKKNLELLLAKKRNDLNVILQAQKNTISAITALKKNNSFKYQEIQKFLDNQTAVLDYILLGEKSYLFYMDKNIHKFYEIANKQDIRQLSMDYCNALKVSISGEKFSAYRVSGNILYKKLFPIEIDRKIKKLIVIPDDSLYYLPFESLVVDDQNKTFLGEKYQVSYVQSVSILASLLSSKKQRPNKWNLLAFGDPVYEVDKSLGDTNITPLKEIYASREASFDKLKYSGEEVREISKIFNDKSSKSSIYLGKNASEKNFKALDLNNYNIIHFATHGSINDDSLSIDQPTLILSLCDTKEQSEDGFLKMSDIYKLKLNADLVVLSACNTGLGMETPGEGMVGFSRAFLYAGASSVVVSLWSVSDISTSIFMKKFYTYLKNGHSKAESLRLAKLDLMKMKVYNKELGIEQDFSTPFYWAPFVLYGLPE